jgi:phosphopantothenoylcysteine decarboxylase/phosphopantothenate--cysteine ligase
MRSNRLKILITMGGTREYLDSVRFLTNLSTGRTGRIIAENLATAGHRVTCFCGQGVESPHGKGLRAAKFSGFSDLDAKLRAALANGSFDAVIHLAAVSDYSVFSIKAGTRNWKPGYGKISSSAETLTLTMRKNFKILDRIKDYSHTEEAGPAPFLIGFKLTAGASRAQALVAVKALKAPDLVVHNDTAEMRHSHLFHIYKDGEKLRDCRGPRKLAAALRTHIDERQAKLPLNRF